MSTLSLYKSLLTEKLGTSATSYFTAQARTDAINEAVVDITNNYDIPALFKKSTLSFTSGLATIPTDFFRMVKMWHATDSTPEYTYVSEDVFDQTSSTTSNNWWTIDYDTGSSTRKIYINPTSITSARIRYIKTPTTLSADGDESGLPTIWDDAVAYRAASILANNANQFDKMQVMDRQANESMARAYGTSKNQGGVKGYSRLRSVYEKYSITAYTRPN